MPGMMTSHFLDSMMGAMLILAAPACVLVSAVAYLAYRKRDQSGDD
jgi:hypothetical protein